MGFLFSPTPHCFTTDLIPMLPISANCIIWSGQNPRIHFWFISFPCHPINKFLLILPLKYFPVQDTVMSCHTSPLPWHFSLLPLSVRHSPHSSQRDSFILLLKSPQWLPLRVKFKFLIRAHKSVHGIALPTLCSLSSVAAFCLINCADLCVPQKNDAHFYHKRFVLAV